MEMNLLLNQAENLNIDNKKLQIKLKPSTQSASQASFFLLGKSFGSNIPSLGAVIGTARRAWTKQGQQDSLNVTEDGKSLFVVAFKNANQRTAAWNNQPLTVTGSLMSFKMWNGEGKPERVCFREIPLWLHLSNVPMCYKTQLHLQLSMPLPSQRFPSQFYSVALFQRSCPFAVAASFLISAIANVIIRIPVAAAVIPDHVSFH
ncbi:hypothetical protein LINPERPRIM_LOCUS2617 [Linum perenne]